MFEGTRSCGDGDPTKFPQAPQSLSSIGTFCLFGQLLPLQCPEGFLLTQALTARKWQPCTSEHEGAACFLYLFPPSPVSLSHCHQLPDKYQVINSSEPTIHNPQSFELYSKSPTSEASSCKFQKCKCVFPCPIM